MMREAVFLGLPAGEGARNEKQPSPRASVTMLRWIRQFFARLRAPQNSGARGEQRAAEWLRRTKGFTIVARNWRDPRDRRHEIDLVCRDGEALVFIEVKARAAGALVPGYFAVDRDKKKVMRRAIDAYLRRLAQPPRTFRFDVVEIAHGREGGAVEESDVLHFENIPLFPKHYHR